MAKSKQEPKEWTELSSGLFNQVYIDGKHQKVLKTQRANLDEKEKVLDEPHRSKRIWDEINFEKWGKATLHSSGWVCPYIPGERASDQEMSECVIEIFNHTGRIVVDAPAKSTNIKKTPEGKSVCIDVGCAFQLEQRTTVVYKGGLTRRRSQDSLDTWAWMGPQFKGFFQDRAYSYPITTNTIQALLFIKANYPNVVNANFLKYDSDLIYKLADAYNGMGLLTVHKALKPYLRAATLEVETEIEASTPQKITISKCANVLVTIGLFAVTSIVAAGAIVYSATHGKGL